MCQALGKRTGHTQVTDASPHLPKSFICCHSYIKLHLGNFFSPALNLDAE